MGKSELAAPLPSPGPLTVAHLPLRQSQGSALLPALLFLAFWYAQAALMFLLVGFETKGGSIDEINRTLDTPGRRRT
jgi:hypothetical protein